MAWKSKGVNFMSISNRNLEYIIALVLIAAGIAVVAASLG
jgi:hypothetical protein